MRTGFASIGVAALVYACAAVASLDAAQDPTTPPTSLTNAGIGEESSGEAIFRATCAACHATDGAGSPQSVVGFALPLPNGHDFPDFNDCPTNTVEPAADWAAVVTRGGPIRGLDRHMPAFGDALSGAQIERVIDYIRTFCADPSWPSGDLNLPRPFFTEKAFPENEAVWTTGVALGGTGAVGNELLYEHRIGPRTQWEIAVPIDFQQTGSGAGWNHGLGDVEIAVKRAFYASVDRGRIVSAGAAVTLPTGKENEGLGNGVTVWEPFAMFGQILGVSGFLQAHGGIELPTNTEIKPTEGFIRAAVGYTYAQDQGFGRAWTPMMEILWAHPRGEDSEFDVVPQMQVSLSKLQHVLLNVGVRVPLTQRDERKPAFLTYLLWDWFDGGLTQFWK
jgi:mono/diheme cytochrome c family protein